MLITVTHDEAQSRTACTLRWLCAVRTQSACADDANFLLLIILLANLSFGVVLITVTHDEAHNPLELTQVSDWGE